MRKGLLIIFLSSFLMGCAKDYFTKYEARNTEKAFGSLIVEFSSSMKKVSITVNEKLVASDRHTKKVIVNHIPVGSSEVRIMANSWKYDDNLNKTEKVDIKKDKIQTILIDVPPKSNGYWITQTVIYTSAILAAFWATFTL